MKKIIMLVAMVLLASTSFAWECDNTFQGQGVNLTCMNLGLGEVSVPYAILFGGGGECSRDKRYFLGGRHIHSSRLDVGQVLSDYYKDPMRLTDKEYEEFADRVKYYRAEALFCEGKSSEKNSPVDKMIRWFD